MGRVAEFEGAVAIGSSGSAGVGLIQGEGLLR